MTSRPRSTVIPCDRRNNRGRASEWERGRSLSLSPLGQRFRRHRPGPATSAKGDGHAYLDAANCGAAVGDNSEAVQTRVSTDSEDCHVSHKAGYYDNWDAFAAAQPCSFFSLGRDAGQKLKRGRADDREAVPLDAPEDRLVSHPAGLA